MPVTIRSASTGATTTHVNLQVALDAAPAGDELTILSPSVLTGAGNTGVTFPWRSVCEN